MPRATPVLDGLTSRWEVIFSDDGSRDGTWENIISLHQADPRIRGVRLSRNFGHQYAVVAGLTHARGQAVISMDADMQHPPSVIPALVEKWREGAKILKTVRRDNTELSTFKRYTAKAFCCFFSYFSGVEIQPGMADFRLLDHKVLEEITAVP